MAETKKSIAGKRRKEATEKKKAEAQLAAQERAAKRAKFSEELRRTEQIQPLNLGEGIVQVEVQEEPIIQESEHVRRIKVIMFC
jgi:hypothetical protein